MKRFVAKLLLALLPLFLYAALFFAYEPYNYWGLHPEKSGDWAKPLARMRAFLREPSENIILGDSRMTHFDTDELERLTGLRYANLSSGGQALNLSREMYNWARTKTKINHIIIDASFYQLRAGNNSPSAQPAFYIAEHPLEYMTTRDYVVEAALLCRIDCLTKAETIRKVFLQTTHAAAEMPTGSGTGIVEDQKLTLEGKYRPDLVSYTEEHIIPVCSNYSLGEEQMGNLCYILDDCRKNGGEPLVILPPVQEVIWDYVIYPLKLEPYLVEYREKIAYHAKIYDMEWVSDFAKDQDIYADGFHFLRGDGYWSFTEATATGKADFLRVIPYQGQERNS